MKKNIIDNISIQMMETDELFGVTDEEILNAIRTLDNINMTGCDGRTVLIHACLYNREHLAKQLLDIGADINHQDNLGTSALHAAVIVSNLNLVKMLLSRGIFVDVKDEFGNTPLFEARQTDIDIIRTLLENGSDCLIENNYGISAYKTFEAYPDVIEIMDGYIKKQ